MHFSEYSLVAVLRAIEAGTWATMKSAERTEHRKLWMLAGEPPREEERIARVPGYALLSQRDMTTVGVSGSNYLAVNVMTGEFIPALRDASAAVRLGAQAIAVPRGTATLATVRGAAGATAYWLPSEGVTQITPSQPTLGSIAAAPKTIAGLTTLSRQLLVQGANTEEVVRTELRRAVGEALDTAVFQGSGNSGQPLGIVGTSGIGAFTGTSLNQAALRNAQADLGTAKAIVNPATLGYVTTPAVAETLSTRARVASSDRMLWEGPSHEGVVEGLKAISTASVPTATAILGDWSSCQIVEFSGGIVLEADPYSSFSDGRVSFRILLDVDVIFLRPAAFTLASSIT